MREAEAASGREAAAWQGARESVAAAKLRAAAGVKAARGAVDMALRCIAVMERAVMACRSAADATSGAKVRH
jgi:hypothetical protein